MGVFNHPEFDHHDSIHFFEDPASGLKAIIAIHSTALGPAAGGCRRWTYTSDDAALTDALRLSRGMTYKNAIAGLPFGGGKSVILASEQAADPTTIFEAFGRAVHSLQGRYITAEDVGVSVDDMRIVRTATPFVSGLPQDGTSAGGDPSPWTALGVFHGIEAAVAARLGKQSLTGVTVAVQGVGHVGAHLCTRLHDAGAKLIVADVNRDNLSAVRKQIPVDVVEPRDILSCDADVLAPCALGNVLNAETIPRLRAAIVAGAANNQLASADDGARLAERGILYAPDYVINAGGVISVALEYLGDSTEEQVRGEIWRIPERLRQIFADAESRAQPTSVVADELARQIVKQGGNGALPGKSTASRLIA